MQAKTKPQPLRDRLKESIGQEILDAAEATLAETGLAQTAMAAVAERAGVSVGTLYNYFKDKEELFTSLFEDRRTRFQAEITAALEAERKLPFAEQLANVVRAIFAIFDSRRTYLKIVLANEKPPSRGPDGAPNLRSLTYIIDRLRPLTALGVKERALQAKDADLYASALAALIRGVMIERLADEKRSFTEGTPFVVRMFLQGAGRHV